MKLNNHENIQLLLLHNHQRNQQMELHHSQLHLHPKGQCGIKGSETEPGGGRAEQRQRCYFQHLVMGMGNGEASSNEYEEPSWCEPQTEQALES